MPGPRQPCVELGQVMVHAVTPCVESLANRVATGGGVVVGAFGQVGVVAVGEQDDLGSGDGGPGKPCLQRGAEHLPGDLLRQERKRGGVYAVLARLGAGAT